jgi:hypothetical protein
MSGVMLCRIFAAASVVCLVGFLSAAPGWAQGPGPEEQQAVQISANLTRAMQAAAETCNRPAYDQAAAQLGALQAKFMGVPLVVYVPPYPNSCARREAVIQRRLDALIQYNNDFFVGGSVGGMGASTKQTQGNQFTLGGPDAISGSQQDIQPGSVAGGVVVGYNGPIINLSGFRFIPGVVGSVEWMDAKGTIETIQNVGATRIATNNTFTDHRIITAGGRLTIGNLPSLLGMSATMPFLPFVEGGEAWVNKSITWNPISGPAGVPLSSEKKTLNLASPYVGVGLTGRPFQLTFGTD